MLLAGSAIAAAVIGAFVYTMKDARGATFSPKAEEVSPVSKNISVTGDGSSLIVSGSITSGIEFAGIKGISYPVDGIGFVDGSCFGNTTPVNNIKSISFTKVSGKGSIKVHVAYTEGIYADYDTYDFSEKNEVDIEFTSPWAAPMPLYFLLEAIGSVTFSSISFSYGCGASYSAAPTSNPAFPEGVYTINGEREITGVAGTIPALGYLSSDDVSGINVASAMDGLSNMKALVIEGEMPFDVDNFHPGGVRILDLRKYVYSGSADIFKSCGSIEEILLGEGLMGATGNVFNGSTGKLKAVYLPAGKKLSDFNFYVWGTIKNNNAGKCKEYSETPTSGYWTYDVFHRPYVV